MLAEARRSIATCVVLALGPVLAVACGDDAQESAAADADLPADAGDAGTGAAPSRPPDAGSTSAGDAAVMNDARAAPAMDGALNVLDGTMQPAADATTQDAGAVPDASSGDPLAPFALDCANLPANGACQGGPREVLLVMEAGGLVAMFDPGHGRFLGYLRRPEVDAYALSGEESLATQGPDQCIWTVGEERGVQRLDVDGTFKDAPLRPHFLPVAGQQDQAAVQEPVYLAFTRDKVYVASTSGTPNPRLTRWNLDGTFDRVVLEDETEVQSFVVLGDGSLVLADDALNRIVRIPAGGGMAKPVLGGLDWPAQISYAPKGKLLVSDISSGTPVYEVAVESGMARTIIPQSEYATNKYGIAPLRNGKWLVTGGDFLVSVLDPASSNPSGQSQNVWSDPAAATVNFRYVGRACLPNAVVESRASKPANDSCIEPPAGPVLFEQTFETGIAPLAAESGANVSIVDEGATAASTKSVRIQGVTPEAGALSVPLAAIRPSYVRYFARINSIDVERDGIGLGALSLRSADERIAGTNFYNGYLNATFASLQSGENPPLPEANRWFRIEMRNMNWATRTYDLYVDCVRRAEGISIPPDAGDDVRRLLLDNYAAGEETRASFFDDILIK
jgi:hypothetical protein